MSASLKISHNALRWLKISNMQAMKMELLLPEAHLHSMVQTRMHSSLFAVIEQTFTELAYILK
jgi:hypothetical protein